MCCVSPAPSFEGRNTNRCPEGLLQLPRQRAPGLTSDYSSWPVVLWSEASDLPSPQLQSSTKTLGDCRSEKCQPKLGTGNSTHGVECSFPSSWYFSLVHCNEWFNMCIFCLKETSFQRFCLHLWTAPLVSGHRNVLSLAQAKTGLVRILRSHKERKNHQNQN